MVMAALSVGHMLQWLAIQPREESGVTTASELAAPTVNRQRQQFVPHLPQTQTRSHEVKEAAKRP